jgi:hypothetical protein
MGMFVPSKSGLCHAFGDGANLFPPRLRMRLTKVGTPTGVRILVFLLSGALAAPAAAQNLVVNGSFEADACNSGGSGQRLGLSGGDMSGWWIPSTDGTYPWCLQNTNPYGAGPAADGNQWLVLGENSAGSHYTIQQTLNGLTPGNSYNLGFSIASEQGCCSAAEVSFLSGSSTAFQDFIAPISGSYWTQWGVNSMSFLATNSSVTFQFRDISTVPFVDLGLDAVSVFDAGGSTTIPEPASLALLGTGLLGLLPITRRKFRK